MGAHAMAVHGYVRATQDSDVFIEPSETNCSLVLTALEEFGLGGVVAEPHLLALPDRIATFGIPPNQIDLLTGITGVSFDEAWRNRVRTMVDSVETNILSAEDIVANKRSTGRLKDLADAEAMEKLLKRRAT